MRSLAPMFLLAALAGCGGDPKPAPHGPPPAADAAAHLAIVTDRSDSIERKDGAACGAVRTVVEHALFRPAGSLFAPGARLQDFTLAPGASSVKVTTTADAKAPRVAASVYAGVLNAVEITMDTPPEVAQRQMENANRAMVEEVGIACQRTATQMELSPIYDAVKTAASDLTNLCATGAAACLLVVQTDWVETAESSIKAAVDALRKKPDTAPPAGLPTIDLQKHVTVLACGSGQSSEKLSSDSREAIRALWRDHVFVNARAWVEQDQCPGYAPNPALAAPAP